jgi:hypothetical protein
MHRRIALGTDGVRRLFRHADYLAGMYDLERLARTPAMAFKFCFDLRLGSNQQYANTEVSGCLQRALDFRLGRAVGPHYIQSYGA